MAKAKKTTKKEKYITLRTSKKGTESYQITIRAYGQTVMKSVLISDFPSKKSALQFACQLRDEMLVNMAKGISVSQFKTVAELYQETNNLITMRMKTKDKHDIYYRQGIEKYGKLTIDKITSADIQQSINEYAKTHTKRATSGLLAVWRQIYKVSALLGINVIDRTVAVVIPECVQGTPRKKDISDEDLKTFCDCLVEYNSASITGHYRSMALFYAIQIMRYTGSRPAECFALRREDINLIAGNISVNKAVRSTHESYNDIGATKTEKSRRIVPISEKLRPILRECLAWSRHDFILADYHGNLFSIDDIDTLVLHVRKQCGVDFTLYMLRHQFSTDLYRAGVASPVIRDLMGHESATMSLDYATSNDADRATAINEISRKMA
ncbi:MAG: site-specific integrase [Solobacterium sp.]|nr:site-specific integrase [Solobacterium sp.]